MAKVLQTKGDLPQELCRSSQKKRRTTSFQPPAKPKKSLGAVVVFTVRRLDFLRPLGKVLFVDDRNFNVKILNHLRPQAEILPDAERGLEEDMIVATFSESQVCMERRALPIVPLILRYSTAEAIFVLRENERSPEGCIITLGLQVFAGEMIGQQQLRLHEVVETLAVEPWHVLVQQL